jgi:putative salt-induced outer membrane protein YdiY
MKKFLLATSLFLAALCRVAAADVVNLANGDRLTGEVKELADGKLTLSTEHSGTVSISWDKIADLRTEKPVEVKLEDGTVVRGTITAGEAGKLLVRQEGQDAPVPLDRARVTRVNEPPVRWHGQLTLSMDSHTGNTDKSGLFLASEANRVSEASRIQAKLQAKYEKEDGELSEQNAYALGKYDHRFSTEIHAYASGEYRSDRFEDLTARAVASVGPGYEFLHESWIELIGEAGPAYVYEQYHDGSDEQHFGGRVSVVLRIHLPFGFRLEDSFTWYPNFEFTPDWQIHNEASLSTPIAGGWSIKAGMITDYDNRPLAGKLVYDHKYYLGLSLSF